MNKLFFFNISLLVFNIREPNGRKIKGNKILA